MRSQLLPSALVLVALLPAQDTPPTAPASPAAAELAAAKTRLAAALAKTATVADTAFTVAWGADKKKKDNDNPFAALTGGRATGKVTGSWHRDELRLAFDGDNADELLIAGRRALAKDADSEWKLRSGRYADGNKLDFVPDPSLLLQQLAAWDLAVTQRTAGSLDDRPVEIVSATLSPEQAAEAVWSGLLPEAITQASGGVMRFAAIAAGGGGARPAPPAPTTTIDVAFHLDPGTNLIHQVQFRGWTKADGRMGAAGQFVVVGRAVNVAGGGGGDEEEEEEDAKAEPAKDAPLVYENGLPVRPRKKTSVCDCTVRLADHGKKAAAELTDAQKKLLGR
ncbi:MAG: hypothetical protein WAT39_01220 [Planctomycetota bacterium]